MLLNFAFNDAHRGVPVDTDGDSEVDSTMGAVIDAIEPLVAAEAESGCWDARALAISGVLISGTPTAR